MTLKPAQVKQIQDLYGHLEELPEKRNRYSKHFRLDTGEYRTVVTEQPLHFKNDSGTYYDIDPSLRERNGGIEITSAAYTCRTLPVGLGFVFANQEEPGFVLVEITQIGGATLGTIPKPVIKGESAWYYDVVPGIDVELRYLAESVKLFRYIKDSSAPRSFTYTTTRDKEFSGDVGNTTVSWDSGGQKAAIVRRYGNIARVDSEWVSTGRSETRTTTETWTGEISEVDPATRVRSWSTDVVYPLVIDPSVSVTAGTGTDIGYGIDGFTTVFYTNYFYAGVGFGSSYTVRAGMRWQAVNVPNGSTVSSATVKMYTRIAASGTNGWKLQLEFDNVDDAPTWAGNDRPEQVAGLNVSSKVASALSASQYWTFTGAATVVQSILGRAGWSSGNDMRAVLNPVSATSSPNLVDFSRTTRPVLDITYTAPAPEDFTSVGSFITHGTGSGGTGFTTTTDAAISSGDLLIVIYATDNTTTTDTQSTDHTSITVDGQSMTKIREYTNGQGSAAAGATVSVWMLQNSNAVASGQNVVTAIGTSRTDHALTGWKFTVADNGKTVTEQESTYDATDGGDAPSMSTSTMTSRSYLCIRSIGSEGETAALVSTTTGWTEITGAVSTTAGGATANIEVHGEFLIDTATSFTSDPDSPNNRDQAAILTALYLAEAGGAAPPQRTLTGVGV